MSSPPDNTLPDPDQTMADLLRELAARAAERDEARTERDEALARETAIAEVLQAIDSSPGDLAPVFKAILEKAHALCEASFGGLMIYDGERFRSVAQQGVPEAFQEFIGKGILPAFGDPFSAMVAGAPLSHIHDLAAVAAEHPGNPLARAAVDLGGIRTFLVVPLRRDNALLGVITAYRQEVRPFSDKQIALLQNFAVQAVIAMENARLLTETREALEQQTATAEVLQVINSSPGDLTPVFDAILEKAHTLCGADHGTLSIADGQYIRAVATHGIPDAYAQLVRQPYQPPEGTPIARLVRGERIVHLADAAAEDNYRNARTLRRLIEIGGVRTTLLVPLRKDGQLLGVITAFRQEVRLFSDREIALLQNFAAQAVIAMENARLLGDLRERTDDLQQSLQYQTAASDVLKVISRSTFDLQPVLDTLVESAVRLCAADFGHLSLPSADVFRPAATFAFSPDSDAFVRGVSFGRDRGTVVGRAMLESRPVFVGDIADDPDYNLTGAVSVARIRAVLGVPLLRDGEAIGVFGLGRLQPGAFTDRQVELVQTFADQAVIAMENARLLTETREALEQQTATAEVLQVINSSPGSGDRQGVQALRGDLCEISDRAGLRKTNSKRVLRIARRSFLGMTPDGFNFLTSTRLLQRRLCATRPAFGSAKPNRPQILVGVVARADLPAMDVRAQRH